MKYTRKSLMKIATCLFLLNSVGISNMFWQITHDGWGQGRCALESNTVSVTLYPTHMDVVEEAVIRTLPEERVSGDRNSLEIGGDFRMPAGTALRAMLLWNGNQVLQARLKDKIVANEEYEEVVDRNAVRPVVRDPALIEYRGNGLYNFKIYPVEMGKSRKIRILYTVPLNVETEGLVLKLQPVFEQNAGAIEEKEIQVQLSEHLDFPVILKQGGSSRTVRNGIYKISKRQFQYSYANGLRLPEPILFSLSSLYKNRAYGIQLTSKDKMGYYTLVHACMPDSFKHMLEEESNKNISYDAHIKAGDSRFVSDVLEGDVIKILMKSEKPWDNKIYWNAYEENGAVITEHIQTIKTDEDIEKSEMVPLLWGAEYSVDGNRQGLGAIYGFVDRNMSLLALEDDVMLEALAQNLKANEVPPLTEDLIIIDPDRVPQTPLNHASIDIATAVALQDALAVQSIVVLKGNIIQMQLSNEAHAEVLIQLFDLQGRLVYTVRKMDAMSSVFQVQMPLCLKGRYVLQLRAGNQMLVKNIMLQG